MSIKRIIFINPRRKGCFPRPNHLRRYFNFLGCRSQFSSRFNY